MAQIEKGVTFNNFPGANSQVTAELLNDHVANAKLIAGAVSEQVSASPALTDSILIQRATSLFKTTIQQITDLVSSSFLLKSGGTMTGALILNASPTAANQAATKAYVDSMAPGPSSSVPAGTIAMWGTSVPPSGWVEMRGQSTASYPALAGLFGSVIPDMRGEFPRGWANDRNVDAGRQIRQAQEQDLQPHTHTYTKPTFPTSAFAGTVLGLVASSTSATTGSTGTKETRPRNVALMFIVKT